MTIRSVFGIRVDEKAVALWVSVLFGVTQASHGLGMNTADTLFFLRYGVDQLPLMITLSGFAVMAFLLVHLKGLGAVSARRWLLVVTIGCAIWAGAEWVAVRTGPDIVYPIIWVSTQVILWLTLIMMWNSAESVCDTRQAKRLFPLFASAGVAGGVVGNLATGSLAELIGTENILLVQAALLLMATLVLIRVRGLVPARTIADAGGAPSGVVATLRLVMSNRLLRLSAVVGFAFSLLFFLVVFPFSQEVAGGFATETGVAGFLGLFSSLATAATFLFSLFVTRRIFSRFGLVFALMIVPLIYGAGFGTWLVSFGLVAAALVRGAQWIAVNAVGGTAYTALFNFLPGERRGQTMTLMTAIPAQLGTVFAGLLLLAGSGLGDTTRFVIGLAMSLITLFVVIAMRPAYLDAIVEAVRRGLIGVFNVPQRGVVTPEDAEMRRTIENGLSDPRPEARAVAVSVLARVDVEGRASSIEPLLNDSDSIVRLAAFDSMCLVEPARVRRRAVEALGDPEARIRLQAVRSLGDQRDPETVAAILPALDDPDPEVRIAAAGVLGGRTAEEVSTELLESGDIRSATAVLVEAERRPDRFSIDTSQFLHHPSRRVRAAAARAHAAGGGNPGDLVGLLDDVSPSVRAAVAESLATNSGGRQALLGVLETGSLNATEASLRALTPMRTVDYRYAEWARSEAIRAGQLESLAESFSASTETSPTIGYLQRVLESRAKRLQYWVILAMANDANRDAINLVARGVRSRDAETKAGAIEALESLGDRSVLNVLIPLLEPEGLPGGTRPVDALETLAADFDPWLRALALRGQAERLEKEVARMTRMSREDHSDLVRDAVAGFGRVSLEHIDTLSVMDRVLALQRVPMFSALDPEELEMIARVTTETVFEPGELIYADGENGDEMLVIADGAVDVTKRRGDGRADLIQTYRAGDHVGELALILGGVRAADVTAGPDGVHGIVLGKSDFLSIIEERPAVAIGMLETLAGRIVDQT